MLNAQTRIQQSIYRERKGLIVGKREPEDHFGPRMIQRQYEKPEGLLSLEKRSLRPPPPLLLLPNLATTVRCPLMPFRYEYSSRVKSTQKDWTVRSCSVPPRFFFFFWLFSSVFFSPLFSSSITLFQSPGLPGTYGFKWW